MKKQGNSLKQCEPFKEASEFASAEATGRRQSDGGPGFTTDETVGSEECPGC